MMRPVAITTSLAMALLPGLTSDTAREEPSTIYHGGVLIDGTGNPPLRDGVIVVTGATIACAGRRADCGQYLHRLDAQWVDLSGSWMIPGLIDLHFHLDTTGEPDFRPLLEAGVTTVREVGPPVTAEPATDRIGHGLVETLSDLSRRLERGELPGPRMEYCGPGLHSSEQPYAPRRRFIFLRTDTDVGEVVGYLVDRGASCIKLIGGVTRPHMQQVLNAAAEAGVAGLGHSSHEIPLSEQLDWPWAEIHHAWFPLDELLAPDRRADLPQGIMKRQFAGWARFDPDAAEAVAIARKVAERGIAWVPTLVAEPFPWGMDEAMVHEFLSMGAEPGDRDLLGRALFDPANPPATWADSIAVMARVMAQFNMRWAGLLHESGVRLLAGTDQGVLRPMSLHDELEHLVAAGLGPAEALAAATRDAALALGLDGRIGTLTPGAAADFVVLDADPLEDIRNTRRIRKVIQGGRVVTTPPPPHPSPIPGPRCGPGSGRPG